MQKSDLKDLIFFHNRDGSVDEVAMSLNCFECSVYNILNNSKALSKEQIVPLFIKDINPTLWCDNTTGVFKITNQNSSLVPLWHKYVSVSKQVKREDTDSIHYLEEILDRGKVVVIQTVFPRLKYYIEYNPDFDLSTYDDGESNHVNILLYNEDDKFYFADKIPDRANLENYVPYEFNNQIGIILKSELAEATNYFLRYYTLDINELKFIQNDCCKKDIVEHIHSIAGNYTGRVEHDGDYTRYYGVAGIEKLMEYCNQGVDMKKYFHTPDWGLSNRITFDIWMLHGSRRLLWEYLVLIKNGKGSSEEFEYLMNTTYEARTQWIILQRSFAKLVKSDPMLLNAKIAERIQKILEVENRLNKLLENFSF